MARVLDALRETPSVAVVQGGSFGQQTSLFLRGGQSNYTQVLIDGVVVNDPGGAIDFANLTTDNIDRIEIVRGPASVLYGANAVTGVIQIFTRKRRRPAAARAHGRAAARTARAKGSCRRAAATTRWRTRSPRRSTTPMASIE